MVRVNIDKFQEKHTEILKMCSVEMGLTPNCDYPPLATGFNYFVNADENDKELTKYVFTIKGITGEALPIENREGFLELLEKNVLEFNNDN